MKRSLAGSYSCGYCLSLGDGSTWWITGDKESARWIDKLAIIMGLQECTLNDSPKLIFSRIENTDYARDELSHIAFPHLHSRDYSKGWACFEYKSIRIWHHNSIPHVICELRNNEGVNEYVNMCFSLHPIYQKSVYGGAVPFHAALVEFEGRGVLLAAPGDTGKTTCCQRLPDHWQPLCDDQALVVHVKQGGYRVHPLPTWSDYFFGRKENTWNVQYSVPLEGVFFLEPSELDEVVPIGAGEATVLINESATQVCQLSLKRASRDDGRKFRKTLFNDACELAKMIPAFRLRVSLSGRFWEQIEKVLGW